MRDLLYWKRNRILRFAFLSFAFEACIGLSACSQKDNFIQENDTNKIIQEMGKHKTQLFCLQKDKVEQDIDINDIFQEIDEYKKKYISLYTSNVSEDMESAIIIEEYAFSYINEQSATLMCYLDLLGNYLRHKIQIDGETGNVIINYYLCENFVWISKQTNYYSSWIPDTGYQDILFSEIEQWIIIGETVYILHDNSELEEMSWERLDIPILEEIMSYIINEKSAKIRLIMPVQTRGFPSWSRES